MDRLNKIEVAKRQLVSSIELFFMEADPVSVFSLATNSWEIIDVLCNRRGIDSFSNQAKNNTLSGKSLKHDYINSPYRNFFKHADRDPDGEVLGFSDLHNDHIIFLGVEDYIRLNRASPVEFQVFQLWYLSVYSEKIRGDELERILCVAEVVFPEIAKSERSVQKMLGRKAIYSARADKNLCNDPKVEATVFRLL